VLCSGTLGSVTMVLSGGLGESASHGYLPGKSAWTARTASPLCSRRTKHTQPGLTECGERGMYVAG